MTRAEFNPIMAMLIAGVSPKVPPTKEQMAVYFDLLSDLDAEVLKAGVRQVLIEHQYPTLPPVGMIRKFATTLSRPPAIASADAWDMALRAAQKHGLGTSTKFRAGQLPKLVDHEAEALRELPGPVAYAVRRFGYRQICDATEKDIGIVRAQFLRCYEQFAEKEQHEALMPPSVSALANQLAESFGAESKPLPALPVGRPA